MIYGQDLLEQCLGKSSEEMAALLRNQAKLDVATSFINFLEHEKDKLAIESPEYVKSRTVLALFLANPITESALRNVSTFDLHGEQLIGVPALNYAINILFNTLSRIKVNNVNKYAVRVIISAIHYLVAIPFFSAEHAALVFARFKYGLDLSFIRKAKNVEKLLAAKFV